MFGEQETRQAGRQAGRQGLGKADTPSNNKRQWETRGKVDTPSNKGKQEGRQEGKQAEKERLHRTIDVIGFYWTCNATCRFLVTMFSLRLFQGYKPAHTPTTRNHECLMGHSGFLSDHHRIIQQSKLTYFGIFMTHSLPKLRCLTAYCNIRVLYTHLWQKNCLTKVDPVRWCILAMKKKDPAHRAAAVQLSGCSVPAPSNS